MTRRVKTFIIVAVLFILLAHFTTLFFYSFSQGKYSFYYTYPFFQQSWSLFVPPPSANYKLLAVYGDRNEHAKDIFSEILINHQSNRFNGSEPLLIALSNSIYYFEQEQNPDAGGINFRIIEQFAVNYLNKTNHLHLKTARLFVLVSNAETGNTKVYHN